MARHFDVSTHMGVAVRCKVERRNIPDSELEDDPVYGVVHRGKQGWHTVGGTILYGDPPNLRTNPSSIPLPAYPPAEIPLNPPAPPPVR